MKTAIVVASVHHGNTRKLVDAIAAKYEVDVIDALTEAKKDLSVYDAIGFASGIYGSKFHPNLLSFAQDNLPDGKKVFFICTNAMKKPYTKSIQKITDSKNCKVLGAFHCEGFNTFAFFKWFGGTSKGHPDAKDIADCLDFYAKLGL